MKKKILGLCAMMSIISVANTANTQGEIRVGVGYEPFRFETNVKMQDFNRVKDGFTIGAEWLPYRTPKGWGQLGVGIEHSFGRTTLNMEKQVKTTETKESEKPKEVISYEELGSTTPIYLVGKLNLISAKDMKFGTDYDLLYLTGRVGYSVNVGKEAKLDGTKGVKSTFLSGPYAGIGIGSEYKYGFVEAVYGLNYIPTSTEKFTDGNFVHKVGITIGGKFDYTPKKVFEETNKIEQENITFDTNKVVAPVEETIAEIPVVDTVIEDVKTPVVDTKVPTIKKEAEPKYITGKSIVKFEFDRDYTTPEEHKNIEKTRDVLNTFRYVDVNISGHTDTFGSAKYNMDLGQRRADYVANELNKLGINETVNVRSVKSFGETKPISKGKTKKSQTENRRVEIDFDGWWDLSEDVVK